MPTESINPSYVMGHIMRYWDTIINPALQSGDIKGLTGVVLDCSTRGTIVLEETGILQFKNSSYSDFDISVRMLRCLVEELGEEIPNPGVVEHFRLTISRYLSQVDILMRNDEDYKLAKANG